MYDTRLLHGYSNELSVLVCFITWMFGRRNYITLWPRALVLGYDFLVAVDFRPRNHRIDLKG